MASFDKLQSLYRQLDRNSSAGEDVVADLRKEINNLELAYLKEEVLPHVASVLGAKIKNLRCGLDCSIQFDEDGQINYTFCTTGSMLMVKDSINANACTEQTYTPKHPTIDIVTKDHEVKKQAPIAQNIRIVDYSEKAIAVYGDTKQLADALKALGGYFNARLKEGPGWVFSKKRRSEIEELLKPYRSTQSTFNKECSSSDDLFSSIGLEVADSMTEDDWIKAVTNMKCMPYNGFIAPHKAIFLLTIIEAIRCNYQKDNRIYPTKRMEETYRILWNKYVPKDWPFTMNFFQPYAHMSGERFYEIVKVNERAKFNINLNWTSVQASRYIKYGILEERLFELLKNKQFANRVTDSLLQKYLNQASYISKNQHSSNRNDHLPCEYLYGFRKYLLSQTNKFGNPFAESSINVYIAGLKNEYMQSMVRPYSSDGLIESINNIHELEELHSKVKADASNRIISNSVQIGLRLYINYRIQKSGVDSHKEVSLIQDKPTIEHKSKPLNIVSITAEHIYINEGTPTSMIVQFINEIGPELVADMHIKYLGGELVGKTPNPTYIRASKKLYGGYWINTNSSTRTKIEQIKTICSNLGIKVNIDLGNNSTEIIKKGRNSAKTRTLFSLNGHSQLNKRQSVLACVRLFMALNPNASYEIVEQNFPPELQGSYGVIAKLARVQSRISHGYDDDKRYFLDEDKILKAKNGVEFVVCHQWGTQFPKFQEHIKKRFGWSLEEI